MYFKHIYVNTYNYETITESVFYSLKTFEVELWTNFYKMYKSKIIQDYLKRSKNFWKQTIKFWVDNRAKLLIGLSQKYAFICLILMIVIVRTWKNKALSNNSSFMILKWTFLGENQFHLIKAKKEQVITHQKKCKNIYIY